MKTRCSLAVAAMLVATSAHAWSECPWMGDAAKYVAELKQKGATSQQAQNSLYANFIPKGDPNDLQKSMEGIRKTFDGAAVVAGVYMGAWKDTTPDQASLASKKYCIRNGGR